MTFFERVRANRGRRIVSDAARTLHAVGVANRAAFAAKTEQMRRDVAAGRVTDLGWRA